jgi:hypothetical protein
MISQLVVFGDSWTYGAELEFTEASRQCESLDSYRLSNSFPGLIAKHYNLNLQNYAIQGGSLQSMIWEFESWIDNQKNIQNSLLLFGLTMPSRQSWWNNLEKKYEHSIVLHYNQDQNNDFFHLNKTWSVLSSSDWLAVKQYQTAVYLFSGLCVQLKIPSVQFNIFPKNKFEVPFSSVINENESIVQMLHRIQKDNPNQRLTYRHHTSELGHQYIAKYLTDYIDQNHLLDRLPVD